MASNIKPVTIKVHPAFFNKIFEKKRRKIQKKLNLVNLSQPKFTEFLVKNNWTIGKRRTKKK